MSSLIIENPRRQGVARRLIQGGITLFFWGLWFYLMLPLLTPLMAMAGIEHLLLANMEPVDYLKFIFPILLFVGLLMLGMDLWVKYNIFLHYRNNRKRPSKKIVYRTQLARHFGVPLHDLTGWHRSEQMMIRMTEHGKIYDVEVKSPPVPPAGGGNQRRGKVRLKRGARGTGSVKMRGRYPLSNKTNRYPKRGGFPSARAEAD